MALPTEAVEKLALALFESGKPAALKSKLKRKKKKKETAAPASTPSDTPELKCATSPASVVELDGDWELVPDPVKTRKEVESAPRSAALIPGGTLLYPHPLSYFELEARRVAAGSTVTVRSENKSRHYTTEEALAGVLQSCESLFGCPNKTGEVQFQREAPTGKGILITEKKWVKTCPQGRKCRHMVKEKYLCPNYHSTEEWVEKRSGIVQRWKIQQMTSRRRAPTDAYKAARRWMHFYDSRMIYEALSDHIRWRACIQSLSDAIVAGVCAWPSNVYKRVPDPDERIAKAPTRIGLVILSYIIHWTANSALALNPPPPPRVMHPPPDLLRHV